MRYNLNTSGGRLGEEIAKFYISQVILALEYLHEKDIIHRDVKPENILLSGNGYVKLTDFGVSKILNNKSHDCRSTSGTHGYMAPEMYVAPGYRHSCPVDWFAMGVTLFELLFGHRPFDSKTIKGNQCCDKGGPYQLQVPFPSTHEGSKLSRSCQHFLRGLLHACPEKRMTGQTTQFRSRRITGPFLVREHPWLKKVSWSTIYRSALPPPFVPSTAAVRSCLSDRDSATLLQQHHQAEPVATVEQENFMHYHFQTLNLEIPHKQQKLSCLDVSATSASPCELSHSIREGQSQNEKMKVVSSRDYLPQICLM